MQFKFHQGIYSVTRITGPSHNFLGLGFDGEAENGGIVMEDLGAGDKAEQIVDPARIKRFVVAGVDAANDSCGSSFQVKRIQYIASDSPPEDVYQSLAERIVLRIESGADYDSQKEN